MQYTFRIIQILLHVVSQSVSQLYLQKDSQSFPKKDLHNG